MTGSRDDSQELFRALRAKISELRAEGEKIQIHYRRLEREYSDWEDRVYKIELAIQEAEEETGITKEEIVKPKDDLEDLFQSLI